MKLATILLLATAGLLEAQVVIKSDIHQWPEYNKARVSAMKSIEVPDGAKLRKPRELPPPEARKAAEDALNAALKRLGDTVADAYQWESFNENWMLRCDGGRVSAFVSAEDLVLEYLTVSWPNPPHPDILKDSPESFTRYAAHCYRKVFGEESVGVAALNGHLAQADGATYNGNVIWNCIEGELLLGDNRFSLQYKEPGGYDMRLSRDVSSADLRDAGEYLAKYPVEVDQRMAVAIVFKTWEGLGKMPAARAADEMRHASSLAVTDSQALQPRFFSDQMIWKNAGLVEDGWPPYVRKVSLGWGLFTVEAELDWRTGEILWMRQGTMSW